MSKTKKRVDLEDDRWKMKGHAHKVHRAEPIVCPDCSGLGKDMKERLCETCEGEGEIWK